MATPAWRAMSPGARLLWIELRGRLRNDGLNNGKVHSSCRKAAEAIGVNKETISFYYAENEHFGFLRKTAEGFLGSDGRGIAAKYRFTDLAYGTHAATRDYEKWDKSPFVYTPRRTGRKKQKPVRKIRTLRPENPDIRRGGNGGSVCPDSELCDLQWSQVELNTGRLHVRRAKGGTPSVHPMQGDEIRALRRLQREQGLGLKHHR
jgi:hypothetical protein